MPCFLASAFAQLTFCESLRDIVACLSTQPTVPVFARRVRHHTQLAGAADKLAGVIARVADGFRSQALVAQLHQLIHGHGRFGGANRRPHLEVHAQAV